MKRRFFHYRDQLQGSIRERNREEEKKESKRLYESIARCNTLIEIEEEARRLLERS